MKKLVVLFALLFAFGCSQTIVNVPEDFKGKITVTEDDKAEQKDKEEEERFKRTEATALDIDTNNNNAVDIPFGGTDANTAPQALINLGAESETHASEHSLGSSDPITVTNLASSCTDDQVLGGTVAGTGVECQSAGASSDVKVAVDSGATAGYLGAAGNDGVLRVETSELSYADGGDYITLGIADDGVDSAHYNADSIDNEHINWADIDYLGDEGQLTTGSAVGDTAFTDLTPGSSYTNFGGASDDTIDELFAAIDTAWPSASSDAKVAIDSGATPDYLGATNSTGALQTSAEISYTDNGDYITLGIAADSLDPTMLTINNAEADEYCLTYEDDDGEFSWQECASGGDVAKVGDCESGDCLDGTSDGGTYISIWDGTANKLTLGDSTALGSDLVVGTDELSYLIGVTSSIQTQFTNLSVDNLANPGGNASWTMGGYKITLTETGDAKSTLEIVNTDQEQSGTATIFKINASCANTDTDCVLLHVVGGTASPPAQEDVLKIVGSASGWVGLGNLLWNISGTNFTSIDNYKVNAVSINDLDMGFTVGQTFTTITASGAITGLLKVWDDDAIEALSDDLSAAMVGGTSITNEGATEAAEYDLPTAASGMSFIATCAELFDIDFEAKDTDKIYIHDDDTITITDDGDTVAMDCTAVSEDMVCYTYSQDGTTWDWICKCGVGACTDGGAGGGN